jgi:hypothetical protein|tara:strand:- start:313 stop:642 length:330 start_codon:yes stop_codon:yes gene_type:complete
MKLKDLFKTAVKGAVIFGASKLIPGVGDRIGGALAGSMLGLGAPTGGGGGYSVQPPSFSRYMEGTYRAGTARSDPMKKLPTDYEDLKYLWDYRLSEYARKVAVNKKLTS